MISGHITQECENTMDDKFSRALTATEDTNCSLPVDISKLCSESNNEKMNHTGHNPPTAESKVTKVYIYTRRRAIIMQTFVLQMHGLYNVRTAKTGTCILEFDFFLLFFSSIFSPQILTKENNKTKVDVDELLEELNSYSSGNRRLLWTRG